MQGEAVAGGVLLLLIRFPNIRWSASLTYFFVFIFWWCRGGASRSPNEDLDVTFPEGWLALAQAPVIDPGRQLEAVGAGSRGRSPRQATTRILFVAL